MKIRMTFLAFVLMVAAVAGCGVSATNETIESIDSVDVSSTIQFVQNSERGPEYDVSVTLPDSWVGKFNVRNAGNAIIFDPIDDFNQQSQVLTIEALSEDQYWKSSGSYPNSHTNIVNKGDTYFVYHLPIDARYAGITAEELAAFSADVPAIIASFSAQ